MQQYPIRLWRTAYDIIACYVVIALAIASVLLVSKWLYPIAFVVIANRILALSLLCHEGLHGNLHPNLKWNDFIGRWFCAFPTFISFSKYRRLHLLHHGTVGSDKWDPDRHLYSSYPLPPLQFAVRQIVRLLTFRTLLDFIMYYSEYPEFFRRKRLANGALFVLSARSDFISFNLFHAVVMAAAIYFNFYFEFLVFISLPLILFTQPYVLLMGGLQHGPPKILSAAEGPSRTIRGSKIYMWLLLPCDICYHAEHHRNSGIPHYWLKTYSSDLESQGEKLWKASYLEAVKDLFAHSSVNKS